ncbi:MAG: DUF2867 domain-containing protein [Ignavibacteria bacterium]|nr:DUF2867 domain-containing protein [Ignavibacteria bacterium]
MKINKTSLPGNSFLSIFQHQYHYVDSYSVIFESKGKEITVEDIGKAFFSSSPTWINLLLELRNKIVRLFGLKTGATGKYSRQMIDEFKYEPGERFGLFKVFSKSNNELILGEDDKHLNFKVSLLLDKKVTGENILVVSTVVIFNNWFGRLYFLPVKPFHKLIVPAMVKSVVRQLTNSK